MNRDSQLQFCKICKHKDFDMDKGIICALTKEQAVFENECENFMKNEELEKTEKKKQQNKISNENAYKTKIRPLIGIVALMIIGYMMIKDPHLYDNVDISGRKAFYKMIFNYIWGIPAGIISLTVGFGLLYNYYKTTLKKKNRT